MTAYYELRKRNSYDITKYVEKFLKALRISNIRTKKQSILQCFFFLSQFVVLTTLDRRKTAECIYDLRITGVALRYLYSLQAGHLSITDSWSRSRWCPS